MLSRKQHGATERGRMDPRRSSLQRGDTGRWKSSVAAAGDVGSACKGVPRRSAAVPSDVLCLSQSLAVPACSDLDTFHADLNEYRTLCAACRITQSQI